MLDGFFQIPGIDRNPRRLEEIRIRARGPVIEVRSPVVGRAGKLRRHEKRPSPSLERHVAIRNVRGDGGSGAVRVDGIGAVLAASGRRAPRASMRRRRNRRPVLVATRENAAVSFFPRVRGTARSCPSRDFHNRYGASGIDERARQASRTGILNEAVHRSRHAYRKIPGNAHVSGIRNSSDLHVSSGADFSVRNGLRRIDGSDDGKRGVGRRGVGSLRSNGSEFSHYVETLRNLELRTVHLEFREVGIACRIIRSRLVPISSGEGGRTFGKSYHGSRKRPVRIVDYVIAGRISGRGAFAHYGRIHRTDVRFYGGLLRVLGISGKRQKTHRRENGENGDYDDELRKGESLEFSQFFHELSGKRNTRAVYQMLILCRAHAERGNSSIFARFVLRSTMPAYAYPPRHVPFVRPYGFPRFQARIFRGLFRLFRGVLGIPHRGFPFFRRGFASRNGSPSRPWRRRDCQFEFAVFRNPRNRGVRGLCKIFRGMLAEGVFLFDAFRFRRQDRARPDSGRRARISVLRRFRLRSIVSRFQRFGNLSARNERRTFGDGLPCRIFGHHALRVRRNHSVFRWKTQDGMNRDPFSGIRIFIRRRQRDHPRFLCRGNGRSRNQDPLPGELFDRRQNEGRKNRRRAFGGDEIRRSAFGRQGSKLSWRSGGCGKSGRRRFGLRFRSHRHRVFPRRHRRVLLFEIGVDCEPPVFFGTPHIGRFALFGRRRLRSVLPSRRRFRGRACGRGLVRSPRVCADSRFVRASRYLMEGDGTPSRDLSVRSPSGRRTRRRLGFFDSAAFLIGRTENQASRLAGRNLGFRRILRGLFRIPHRHFRPLGSRIRRKGRIGGGGHWRRPPVGVFLHQARRPRRIENQNVRFRVHRRRPAFGFALKPRFPGRCGVLGSGRPARVVFVSRVPLFKRTEAPFEFGVRRLRPQSERIGRPRGT